MDTKSSEFERFFYLSSDMLAITDRSGSFLRTNPSLQNVLGWNKTQLEGLGLWEIIAQKERFSMQNNFRNLAKGHPVLFVESNIIKKDGGIVPTRWTAYPDLELGQFYLIGRSTNEELMQNERFRMALDVSPTAIIVVNEDGEINYTTPLLKDVFGYSETEIFNKPIEVLIPTNMHEKHIQHRKKFVEDPYLRPMGMKSFNLWGRHKDGRSFPVDVGLNPVYTLNGMITIVSVIDLSGRTKKIGDLQDIIKNLQADVLKLDKLASIDDLTKLLNRRMLMKHTELHLYLAHQNQEPLSFAMLDIDDFKHYNDTFGHPAGDEVLRKIGEIMLKESRKLDITVRYGGEEFAVLMPQTNQEEASFFVRRVLKKIETFSWKNRAITASAGISTYIASSESPSPELIPQFIIQADEALYKSKGAGKNISTHFLDIPEQELTPHKRGHIS